MELRTLLYEKHGPICTITMSRPEVLNAYNLQMVDELRQVWWDFRDDDSLHVAILTGAGERSFSTGLDAKEIIGKPFASPSLVYAGVPTLTFPGVEAGHRRRQWCLLRRRLALHRHGTLPLFVVFPIPGCGRSAALSRRPRSLCRL